MLKTANKISFLVESQLPDFINEEYELFSKFIQKYYEQLEIQGQPLDIISNIQTYRNIDFYEKNILKQSTTLTGFIQKTDNTITVDDATSFPKNGGYIKIDDEICFYHQRTDTQFLEVSRGVSGNTTIGDLYKESNFITTQSADHVAGSTVQNISNLFLYAFIKSFESQYLADFPEEYLKKDIDKRTLIKNIGSFYRSKGTDSSIKFLFKALIDSDPEPEISYPKDFTLKSSDSNWINVYALKVKVLSGTVEDLIGKTIVQDVVGNYAAAVVDNVRYAGRFDGEDLYELILSEQSVNGTFSIAARTKLTEQVDASVVSGDRINVFSTMAWKKTGEFKIGSETFTFEDKNVNQFILKSRTGTGTHPVGSSVTYGANVSGAGVTMLVYGVLYATETASQHPYSNPGDRLEISEPGFLTNDVKIFDAQNNLRWKTTSSIPFSSNQAGVAASIADLNSNVSAIFEDGEGYYITSSGFPSHDIISASATVPADVQDQKLLRIIRKNPISTTEIYETKYRDVGIATNGIPFLSYKDEEVVLNGPIQKINVTARGRGYQKEPFVLIDGVANLARTRLAGQVVESVIVDTPGNYAATPTVEIVSGRNAKATAVVTNGEITSIVVDDVGEFYSSPPEVRITDNAGKGRFADYVAEIATSGEITGFTKVSGGSFYTQENVVVDIIAVGSGASATADIKVWRKDRYKRFSSVLDSENGHFFTNYIPSRGTGYAYYAAPSTLRAGDNGSSHSPILGFAYDGNPIYGPYGFSDALNPSSSVVRMTTSYVKNISRNNGPNTITYPLGTFINDYTYNDRSGSLDQNNGRFCVTPEFPQGTYAYFMTVSATNVPEFPYILGENYYSLPLDSNYNSSISQDDLPVNANRLRTSDIDKNGDLTIAVIEDVVRGSVSSATVSGSTSVYSVGSQLIIDDNQTSGSGAQGEVASVKGRQVNAIESQQNKCLLIDLVRDAYLFDGDTIIQTGTGATGEIVGNVFTSNQLAIRNVTGSFDSSQVFSSTTLVLSILLDKDSSYTKGATLSLSDGVNAPVATGEVLEVTTAQNTVKVKVITGVFTVSDDLFLTSSDLINTTGSKALSLTPLSKDLPIFRITDNVALLRTADAHGVGVNEKITVDINPDDATTNTTYYVRKRVYQEATLETPGVDRVLSDDGVGRVAILNGGEDYTPNTYTGIALSGGTGKDAEATIVVSASGSVTSVTITDKGTGYSKFDVLTVGDAALTKTDATTPRLQISVDHIGFSIQNAVLNLDSGIGITANDYLRIGSEIVRVISRTDNALTVERAQFNTSAVDHFNGAAVSVYDPGYNLATGYQIGSNAADAIVLSYDPATQKAVFVYDYAQTLSSINELSLGSVFFDQSVDQRLVKIVSIGEPQLLFEFSEDNVTFTRNPVIDVKKFYKYSFDVSHSSMSGVNFDISPSINLNLVTPEKTSSGSIVDLKLGFGSRIVSNNYTTKVEVPFVRYFYFDKNGNVSSEGSYFNVVNDPLQGEKTTLYVTSDSVLYSTGTAAPHDGSGSMTYISKSPFSVGQIESVRITNIGGDYKKVPIVRGIVPTESLLAKATCQIEDGRISSVTVDASGSDYTSPIVVVEGNASLTPIVDAGKVTGIIIDDAGSGYTAAPTITIAESSVNCFLQSADIGIPRNVKIINNGGAFHNDQTLKSSFRSNYIFVVSNFEKDAFIVGETIVQRSGSVEVARARVTSWRKGSNVLVADRVQGIFRENQELIGLSRNKTATIESIDYTEFSPQIKTYFDNLGYYESDYGKIGNANQRITDSYYYQDYSYVVQSKTPINVWRDLIKDTTHPAGFQLFGEVDIETSSQSRMSDDVFTKNTSIVQLWDPDKNKVTVIDTKRTISQNIVLMKNLNVERGVGSVSVDSTNTSEIRAKQIYLSGSFDGDFSDRGNLQGTRTFNIVDSDNNLVEPYNEQALTITLDGILQEPGVAYTISGYKITFAEPPLGPSTKDGQNVPGVTFYGRWFEFKTESLNQKYLRKIRNIFQRSGTWIDSANQLERNRAFIQAETLGYVKDKYSTLAWGNLESKCYRDIGLIIDALAHDLRFGGNQKTVAAVESYFRSGVLDYISGELEATIDAFAYVTRLSKLAMRNWDFVDRQVSWTPGTNEVTISSTDNVAVGMKVSAGRAFPEGTTITNILDGRKIRVSNNSLPLSNASVNTILTNVTTTTDESTTSSIIQIAPNVFLQVGTPYTYSITPAVGVLPSGNAQMTFIWSGINTGTFYDASTLIEVNKVNIQREATHRIYNEYPNFTYPGVPESAYRFKDARRLIYENLQDIVSQTITELETTFGTQYATDKCARDLKIIVAAVAEDTARGGNSTTIEATNQYFDNHDALDGERTQSVYAFEYARELCIEALNNRGTYTDPNIILVPDCANVNSAVTTLFGILISAIDNNQKPTLAKNTGIESWVKAEDFCFRDTGLLVDAVVYCLRYGGNEKVIDFANAYFNNYKLNHVAGELRETIYAYNQARDLMIQAMKNQISGTTIIAPVTDSLVRIDTTAPYCAEVESTITTYAQIVEDTLEGGPDRIAVVPQNSNSTGNWTTLRSYSNINILPDPKLVNGTLKECEEVASALDSLYENIRETLTTGEGTAAVSYPDYIDNENTIFDLYYEDGTPVSTDPKEDLFIALSGVLQHETAYSIDRTSVPNKVVFATPPIWGQEDNTKTVQEPLAVEKFFAHSVGNYLRCEIDTSGILSGSRGPFLILDSDEKKVKTIDDPRFAFVFIDGVLQRDTRSYSINGPAITFTRKIFIDNNVEIILLYGRDTEQTITLYDFERNTYYNKLELTCDAGSPNTFDDWKSWYNTSYDGYQVAYQKIGGIKRFIGNLKGYTTTSNTLTVTFAGINPNLDNSSVFFSGTPDYSDEYELDFTTNTITVARDEDSDYQMQRNSTKWLYGTKKADESFYVKKNLLANLNAGDIIKISGEEDYRTVNELPQFVNPKNYLAGEDVSNDFFGSIVTSNYNGDTRGVGLSVTCSIENGQVSSVTWNKKDLQLLFDEGIIQPTTAYGYDTPPILHFIPVDQQGGGARAEVIVSRGQIIDIVITNPGSGYTTAPKVITARQYDIIKQRGRKVDSLVTLTIGSQIQQQSPVTATTVFEFATGIELQTSFVTSVNIPPFDVQLIIQRELDSTPLSVSREYVLFGPTSTGEVIMPQSQPTSSGITTLELDRSILSQPSLTVEVARTRSYAPSIGSIAYGFAQWESAKFIDTGDILSLSGDPISEVSLQDLEYFEINADGTFDPSNPNRIFNLAYPSINYYLTQLDTSDLPAEGDPGYVATNGVVYANTSNFASSGTILVGREQISYTSKLSDRFLGCTRGVNGTPIEFHGTGEYIRNAL